jgi:four helix bundle protein
MPVEGQQTSEPTSTFEDLEVWQAARSLRKKLSELVKRLPADERYRLMDQILRASRSVTANIAEGYGRFHYQENIQFCRQARGSLFELVDHLSVLLDEAVLSKDDFEMLRADIFRVIRMLNGYIRYLQRRKAGLVQS